MIEIGKMPGVQVQGNMTGRKVSFNLPSLIESRLLIQANSGGGKSYAIRRLLEQSHGQVQQIVLDVEGEFSTLRPKFDYVLAGKGADIPAHPKSAELFARKLLDLKCSAICDLYELTKYDRVKFVRLFLESLVSAPKKLWHPVLIVIDEAHLFCPQSDKAESAAAVIDLMTRGRKRGFCGVLATQRLSKLHKDACAETLNKMVGRVSLDIDQKRARDELGMANNAETAQSLRGLQPGQFFGFGPSLYIGKDHCSGVARFKVGSIKSHHPTIGTRQIEAPPAPTKQIKNILGELANLPEIAEKKARDLADIKKELIQTKAKLTIALKGQPKCDCHITIAERESQLKALGRAGGVYAKIVNEGVDKIRAICDKLEGNDGIMSTPLLTPKQQEFHKSISKSRTIPLMRTHCPDVEDVGSKISKSQIRILRSLAAMEPVGMTQVHRRTLAAHSGSSPKSSGYGNNLSALKGMGFIDYPTPGLVGITNSGRDLAGPVDPIESLDQLHESWLNTVRKSPLRKILSELIRIYPDDIPRKLLAERIDVSAISSGYGNNLSELKGFGAIEYPTPGLVKASELLFPDELA